MSSERVVLPPPVKPCPPPMRIARLRAVAKGHAWIQWKGTEVCMDVHCRCGAHGHVDASFACFYKCLACDTTFAVGQTVRLYPFDPAYVASKDWKSCPPVVDEYLTYVHVCSTCTPFARELFTDSGAGTHPRCGDLECGCKCQDEARRR